MAASFKVEVNPAVLIWARRSAGFRPDEVAKKLGLEEPRIRAWEAGDEAPTIAQLRRLGEAYHRPLAVFLLDKPPADDQAMSDFRSAANIGETSPALRLALRNALERREVALELRAEVAESIGSFDVVARPEEDPEEVAGRIRDALGVGLAEQFRFKHAEAAFPRWRGAIESTGVLVFGLPGVDVHEARGFSFSDRPLPVVAINSKDAPSARVFTLMHEVCHIALHSGEVLCDLSDDETASMEIERFCNHVAGAVLVPREAFLKEAAVAIATSLTLWDASNVQALARRYSVSREVILRRLLILGRTNRKHYADWRAKFRAEAVAYSRKLAESTGGPTYRTKVISQLGRLYSRLVIDAHNREAITTSAASSYLGVKVKHLEPLAAELALVGP